MPISTVDADVSNFGYVQSTSATKATALAGSSLTTDTTLLASFFGFDVGLYGITEGFLDFDTSGIAGTITQVTLSLYCNGVLGSDPDSNVLQARLYDFGPSLGTGDYLSDTAFNGATLLGHLAFTGFTTNNYSQLTSDSGFVGAINRSGRTRLVLGTALLAAGGTPTGFGYPTFDLPTDGNPPYLTITSTTGVAARHAIPFA